MAMPVSVIGLGNLGQPIARRLLDRGCAVRVSDLDPDRLTPVLAAGATELGGEPNPIPDEVTVLVVPDDSAVDRLVTEGLVDRLVPGSLLVGHSTSLPATGERLAGLCAEREISYLDAPVSGGADRAREGMLTAMVGASDSDLARGAAYLELIASHVLHVGPAGAGSAAKLANQLMVFATLSGAYEAMAVAEQYGVSETAILEVVSTSTGASWVAENWGFYDRLSADYDAAEVPPESRPWHKDLLEMSAAAGSVGQGAPLADFLSRVLPEQVAQHARDVRQQADQTAPSMAPQPHRGDA